ncbi:hypothetical protein KEM52_006238 [Ascosphaera acerosa]|nr:hypothetical protein KEM52_006238 [Ascosphaera acerosa]
MLSRRMLTKDEEAQTGDTEVRREDQEKINRFSTLHQRVADEPVRVRLQKDKEDMEEVDMELELADEDELVPYKIGDSFFNLPLEEVRELLAASQETLAKNVSALEDEISEINDELRRLKVELYARFGKGINLD